MAYSWRRPEGGELTYSGQNNKDRDDDWSKFWNNEVDGQKESNKEPL